MQGDAAAVVAALGLLDPRVEGKVGLPDRGRARKGSGLETNVEIGFQECHLKKTLSLDITNEDYLRPAIPLVVTRAIWGT